MGYALAVALLVVMASGTAVRVSIWGSEVRLWTDATVQHPSSPKGWNNLGAALTRDGRDTEAHDAFQWAVDLSERRPLDPMRTLDRARFNLASSYAEQGRYDTALSLTTLIQPRGVTGPSLVNAVEDTWRQAQATGGRFQGF